MKIFYSRRKCRFIQKLTVALILFLFACFAFSIYKEVQTHIIVIEIILMATIYAIHAFAAKRRHLLRLNAIQPAHKSALWNS
ncbi:hypothetical protein [Bizionia paragorgiae]|jgi:NADH:ubiquinone oxidoreductase subunit K|uniref:hypothetical protein n=1 Tax=Bizionia paragorgiae TaxID=283786 RepID=UPI00299F3082|nr:hypothetical protein [Bizionia paragorgiae]MDX1271467.1 hypothetical protein [Bizionia paragorgiae]